MILAAIDADPSEAPLPDAELAGMWSGERLEAMHEYWRCEREEVACALRLAPCTAGTYLDTATKIVALPGVITATPTREFSGDITI